MFDEFFATAVERYKIMQRKEAGLSKPWSKDPVFQNNYFCNVFREDDKVTKWFRKYIRNPLDKTYAISPNLILLSIVAFRWFNRPQTWEVILGSGRTLEEIFGEWDSDWIYQEIMDHAKKPYITGAYMIKTPAGLDKVTGLLWCIDQFLVRMSLGEFDRILEGKASMQEAFNLLKSVPYLGNFMAYQIVCDARFTTLLENAPDINEWAQPGPGSARGLGRIFYGDVNHFNYSSPGAQQEMIEDMKILLNKSRSKKYWPREFPLWEMSTSQHFCCEWDKYCRASEGGRMKRKYDAK